MNTVLRHRGLPPLSRATSSSIRSLSTLALSSFALSFLVSACVPEQAGFDDVQRVTSSRVGAEVQWRKEMPTRLDDESKRLLAQPLTAESAVKVALLNNASLQAEFEKLGVARGELVHARRLPNPSLEAALRYGAEERPELDLDATISLSELAFLGARSGAARAELDAAALDVAGSAVDLAFDVRRVFIDYQAGVQRLELRRTVLESLRASVDMAQKLFDAGNVTDLMLANERAFYEEARIAYARDEAMLVEKRERLSTLMGLWGETGARWSVDGKLPPLVPVEPLTEDIERRAVEASLDLALTKKRFESAARKANLSRWEGWVPELTAGVTAERTETDWAVGPLAEIEVPLFYQGQGATDAALSEMRRERKSFADTAIRLRASARSTATKLQSTSEGVAYYETTLLPLRETVLQQTQLQYNAMNAGVLQLLQAKREQIQTAEAYVELLQEYWTLRADAEQLLAGRMPGNDSRSSMTAPTSTGRSESGGH